MKKQTILIAIFGLYLCTLRADEIHDAIRSGDAGRVKTILDANPAAANQALDGQPPLHMAVTAGKQEIVILLLDHGADIHGLESRYGATPLHLAAYGGDAGMAKLLLARGADPGRKDNMGSTPAAMACLAGKTAVAEYLEGLTRTPEPGRTGLPAGLRMTGSPAPERTYRGDDDVPEELRMQTLETIWNFVDKNYWDPTFHGVNWQEVRARYSPRARQTRPAGEFHRLMNDMLRELKVSHMSVQEALDNKPPDGNGRIASTTHGLKLAWSEGKVLVTGFTPEYGGPAGVVRIGDEVFSVDGQSAEEAYTRFKNRPGGFPFREETARIVALRPGKAAGEKIRIDVCSPGGELRRVELPVYLSRAEENPIEVVWKDHVAHILVREFMGSGFISAWEKALPALRKAKGWILDLRGNRGGARHLVFAIASRLFEKDTEIGRSVTRNGESSELVPGSGADAYHGPVVVLVDEFSGSSSEVMSGGLQSVGRAKVVGRTTVGGVLPSVRIPLPTGAMLQAAIALYKTAKGEVLEGAGVKPDVEIPVRRTDLVNGKDAVLEKALEQLNG